MLNKTGETFTKTVKMKLMLDYNMNKNNLEFIICKVSNCFVFPLAKNNNYVI